MCTGADSRVRKEREWKRKWEERKESGKVKEREKSGQQHFARVGLCRLQFSQVSDRLFALARYQLGIPLGNPVLQRQKERERERHSPQSRTGMSCRNGRMTVKKPGKLTASDSDWGLDSIFFQSFIVAFQCSNNTNSPALFLLTLSTVLAVVRLSRLFQSVFPQLQHHRKTFVLLAVMQCPMSFLFSAFDFASLTYCLIWRLRWLFCHFSLVYWKFNSYPPISLRGSKGLFFFLLCWRLWKRGQNQPVHDETKGWWNKKKGYENVGNRWAKCQQCVCSMEDQIKGR